MRSSQQLWSHSSSRSAHFMPDDYSFAALYTHTFTRTDCRDKSLDLWSKGKQLQYPQVASSSTCHSMQLKELWLGSCTGLNRSWPSSLFLTCRVQYTDYFYMCLGLNMP